jgi:chemotaxis signal transduction protein
MDRNLYERANDCRWWSLSSLFSSTLSVAEPDALSLDAVSKTLAKINGLYTVYDNLVLFDNKARVLAVSNPRYQSYCGKVLDEDWVKRTLSLGDNQSYTVSDFVPTPLYQEKHSYICAAAIRDQSPDMKVVGGIGIIFDSTPQFAAMLNDALPRDENGEVPEGCFGVFADKNRRIISTTLNSLALGAHLDIDEIYFQLGKGESTSGILTFNGNYYAVGACMSNGYREYKGEHDAYHNDVVALIFSKLGEYRENERRVNSNVQSRLKSRELKVASGMECTEIATFYVDNYWLGIPTEYVIESIDPKGLTTVPGAGDCLLGYIMFHDRLIPVVGLWGMLGQNDKRRSSNQPQIIVIRLGGEQDSIIGLMVDDLGEIPEIPVERIEKVSPMMSNGNVLSESLVKPDAGKSSREMIVLLSPDKLRRKFFNID